MALSASLALAALLACALATAPAGAQAPAPGGTPGTGPAGGVAPAPVPRVSRVTCVSRCATTASVARAAGVPVAPKGVVQVTGRNLAGAAKVRFLGRGHGARAARVSRASARSLRVRLPSRAESGPLQVVDRYGQASKASKAIVEVRPAQPAAPAPAPAPGSPPAGLDPALATGHVFPVQGKHDFGSTGARFGADRGGRSHQGHDVMAACGTPLVAARGGVVEKVAYQSLAGHYVVIDGEGVDYDYVYMHLREATPLPRGAQVATGAPIGFVGMTGNAQGCHLHFELWGPPGYYTGGAPIDPFPALQAWAGRSG